MTALLHDKQSHKHVLVAVTHLKAKAGPENEQTRIHQVRAQGRWGLLTRAAAQQRNPVQCLLPGVEVARLPSDQQQSRSGGTLLPGEGVLLASPAQTPTSSYSHHALMLITCSPQSPRMTLVLHTVCRVVLLLLILQVQQLLQEVERMQERHMQLQQQQQQQPRDNSSSNGSAVRSALQPAAVLLCGDLNTTPDSDTVQVSTQA